MSEATVQEVLQGQLEAAAKLVADWRGLSAQVDAATTGISDDVFNAANQRLDEALEGLRETVRQPTVVIATMGTTSGGKSTLVNYLCGAHLMPAAVLEMSAGIVTVEHHPSKKSLLVEATEGALWGTGEHRASSAAEIRRRLQAVMEQYRALRAQGVDLEPPRFRVTFPTRIGSDPRHFGLPPGVRVQLLDLPGLKFVGDSENADVIASQVSRALCLVTYNSTQVDRKKREELLERVIEQVRELRGSPARTLFIVNRIDVFLTDENPETSVERFVSGLTEKLRSQVAEALPEYKREARQLRVLRLSSEPAMCAELLRSEDVDTQNWALERINDRYQALLPDAILDEFPRRVTETPDSVRTLIRDAVLESSYGSALDAALREHLAQHLPSLLLPQHLSALYAAFADASREVDEAIHARIHASGARFEQEKARLESVSTELTSLRGDLGQRLRPLQELASQTEVPDPVELRSHATELARSHGLDETQMAPLVDWMDLVEQSVQGFLDGLLPRVTTGAPLEAVVFDALDDRRWEQLERACARLEAAGYTGTLAQSGDTRTARNGEERRRLRDVNEALNDFAKAVRPALVAVLRSTASREGERIAVALEKVMRAQARELQAGANELAPDLLSLRLPSQQVTRVQGALDWHPELQAGFEVREKQEKTRTGTRKIKAKRSLWNLWGLFGRKEEQIPVFEMRSVDKATLPSFPDVLAGFARQVGYQAPDRAFLGWLSTQLASFEQRMEEFHERQFDRYVGRLLEERERAEIVHEDEVAALEGLRGAISETVGRAKELTRGA